MLAVEGILLLGEGGGGRGRGRGGRHNIIYHTTMAFIMADFTLFRYNFRDGLYFVTGSSFQILLYSMMHHLLLRLCNEKLVLKTCVIRMHAAQLQEIITDAERLERGGP
jgi:hypothetical protein